MASGQQIASLYAEIGANTSQFESALKRSDGLISGVGNTLGTFVKVGIGAAVAGMAAFAAGIGSALTASAGFDKTMSGAKAILGATGAEMTKLNDLAMQLGKDTKFSASEAGSAIEMLGQQGLNVEQILGGAAKATVDLAAATGTDLANAAQIGSKAMKAFDIPADKMQKAINGISGAANINGLTIDGYAQAIGMAGGVAGSVGVSFDDFNASIAAIVPSFSGGSDAGTGFKTFLASLIPQSADAAEAMQKIGLFTGMTGDEMDKTKAQIAKYEAQLAGLDPTSKNYERRADELKTKISSLNSSMKQGQNAFFNADGSMKNMTEVAGILQKSLSGLSDEAKGDALKKIFGNDASRVASALAKMGASGFQGVLDKIGKSDAAEQAHTRMDNLSGDVEQMSGSFDTLKIAIGQAFTPLARKVVQYITGALNTLLGMDFKPFAAKFDFAWERIQKVMERVIGLFGRFASKTAGGLPSILGELGTVFTEWAGDIWSWIQPGLSAAFQNMINWIKNPTNQGNVLAGLSSAWTFFSEWAGYIWGGADGNGGVKGALSSLWTGLVTWVSNEQNQKAMISAIGAAWTFFTDWASYIWQGSDGKGGVKWALGALWSSLVAWVSDEQNQNNVKSAIVSTWNWFTEWAQYIWSGSDGKGGVKWALGTLWTGLVNWVSDDQNQNTVISAIGAAWTFFADWAGYVWGGSDGNGGVKWALGALWNELTSWVTDEQKRNQLLGALSATWDWFVDWADYIWEGSDGKGGVKWALGTLWTTLSSWVTDPAKRTQLYNAIAATWKSFSDWAGSIWNGADGKSGVKAQLGQLWTDINAWLLTNYPNVSAWVTSFTGFAKDVATEWKARWPEITTAYTNFSTAVVTESPKIAKALSELFGVDGPLSGKNFGAGISEAITNLINNVTGLVKAFSILAQQASLIKQQFEALKSLDFGKVEELNTQMHDNWGELLKILGVGTQGDLLGGINSLSPIGGLVNMIVGSPGADTTTPEYNGDPTRLGHRASGGMVLRGQSYIGGEGGRPELFTPGTNGYVHNADDTAALMGGKTLTIQLNVTGESNLPTDRTKLRELTRMLANELNLSGGRLIMQN